MENKYNFLEEDKASCIEDSSMVSYLNSTPTESLSPLTVEDIENRLSISNQQLAQGLGKPSDQVFAELRSYISSRL